MDVQADDSAARDGLLAGALGLLDSAVMAVAGSAPAYSIGATTATLAAAVGAAGPAALLYAGVPMFGIAWAFLYLGRTGASAGAAYQWVGRTLHPVLGYLAGWALIVSATLFMVAGALPAGSLTLGVVSPGAADNVLLVTLVGGGWFALMATMVLLGIRLTARVQWLMSGAEIAVLVVFLVLAVAHARHGAAAPWRWRWLSPAAFHGPGAFAAGALVAAFYYWGWDVSANLAEETRAPRRAPGMGGVIGLAVVFCLFVAYALVTNAVLTPAQVSQSGANVLLAVGRALWPGPGGDLLVLAVVLSAVATLETTLLQVSRTLFAMARDRVMPDALARVHDRWRTPHVATAVVGVFSLALFVLSNFAGSVSAALADAIGAIDLQIVVYYALAGIGVAVCYRHLLLSSPGHFLFVGLWPAGGALFLLAVGAYDVSQMGAASLAVGLGALAAGLIPLYVYRRRGAAYFDAPRLEAVGMPDRGGP